MTKPAVRITKDHTVDVKTIDDFLNKPGFLIRRAHQISNANLEQKLQPFDLTATQQVLLTALHLTPGVDQATLASSVAVDVVTVGRIVKRFLERGLITRQKSFDDGRSQILHLSPQGSALLAQIQSSIKSSQHEILQPLTAEERKAFFLIMRKIVAE